MIIPNSLIAQTFVLLIAYTLAVLDEYDDEDPRNVEVNPLDEPSYFRFIAAPNGNATASTATNEEAAVEFCNHLEQRLNAGLMVPVWTVRINSKGLVIITYLGTGTASITWDAGLVIRNLLGFTGTELTFTSMQQRTATYQPTHTVFLVGRETEAPYSHLRHDVAAVKTRGGRVSATFGGSRPVECMFDSSLHPTTQALQVSRDTWSTPIEPNRDPRIVSDAAGIAPPWSMFDFFGCNWGHALGALWGTFQDEVAATATTYDLVYMSPDSREQNILINRSFIAQQVARGLRFSVRNKAASL